MNLALQRSLRQVLYVLYNICTYSVHTREFTGTMSGKVILQLVYPKISNTPLSLLKPENHPQTQDAFYDKPDAFFLKDTRRKISRQLKKNEQCSHTLIINLEKRFSHKYLYIRSTYIQKSRGGCIINNRRSKASKCNFYLCRPQHMVRQMYYMYIFNRGEQNTLEN